jgi:hypothetical protein
MNDVEFDPEVQALADAVHSSAQALLDQGACPSCLARVLVSEGCSLGQHVGALDAAKAVTDIYPTDEQPLQVN